MVLRHNEDRCLARRASFEVARRVRLAEQQKVAILWGFPTFEELA